MVFGLLYKRKLYVSIVLGFCDWLNINRNVIYNVFDSKGIRRIIVLGRSARFLFASQPINQEWEKNMDFDAVRRLMENDRFAAGSGVKVLEISEGYAKVSLEVEARHFNGVGVVQGGAIFTLADLAFAAAVNSHGNVSVAINVSISFVKAATGGTLYAEAREVAKSNRLASCTVNVTDQAGALVAVFQGMAYRKKDLVTEVLEGGKEERGEKKEGCPGFPKYSDSLEVAL